MMQLFEITISAQHIYTFTIKNHYFPSNKSRIIHNLFELLYEKIDKNKKITKTPRLFLHTHQDKNHFEGISLRFYFQQDQIFIHLQSFKKQMYQTPDSKEQTLQIKSNHTADLPIRDLPNPQNLRSRPQKNFIQNFASKCRSILLSSMKLKKGRKELMKKSIEDYFGQKEFKNGQLAIVVTYIYLKQKCDPTPAQYLFVRQQIEKYLQNINDKIQIHGPDDNFSPLKIKLNTLRNLLIYMNDHDVRDVSIEQIKQISAKLFQNTQGKKTLDKMLQKIQDLLAQRQSLTIDSLNSEFAGLPFFKDEPYESDDSDEFNEYFAL